MSLPITTQDSNLKQGGSAAQTPRMLIPHKYAWTAPFLLAAALLLAIVASLCVGAYPMTPFHAARVLLHLLWPFGHGLAQFNLKEITVMKIIRPPRVLLAALAGMGLGISGTALQGMMRNPLVGPDIVGVTSGAAFGGVVAITLDLPPAGIIVLAFVGGLLAMACTFGLAKLAHGGNNSMILILAGVFIGALFLALVGLVEFYGNVFRIRDWIIGSFVNADWTKVASIAIPTLFGGAVLMALRWRMNLLSLGDMDAKQLGVNVSVLRWTVIAVVSLIVSAQVAVSGIVAWVGLVIPHCARMLVGPDHRRLLPTAGLMGALFVLGLDDLTRSIVHGGLPVGSLTAIVGTPTVCFLLWKSQGKGWGRE
ncbi:MAG: iron ABC transporter permease [Acidobacteriota bacterium]|nr:iron ABC transporter permease [Acidobacteriota bacterium]